MMNAAMLSEIFGTRMNVRFYLAVQNCAALRSYGISAGTGSRDDGAGGGNWIDRLPVRF